MRVETNLKLVYRHAIGRVAFIDESFDVEGGQTFYILAAAIVDTSDLSSTRRSLLAFYGNEPFHASPMFSRGEIRSLRDAVTLIAIEHDGLDIVVQEKICRHDVNGLIARTTCLERLLVKLHEEFDCELFVLDANFSSAINDADQRMASSLRRSRRLSRETKVIHTYPRLEPLLGMPDVAAWAYRQEFTGRSRAWFDPLREQAQVSFVAPATEALVD